ncbi:MAG: hypothetical protein AB1798_02960 [Spirochaetota bacterium]
MDKKSSVKDNRKFKNDQPVFDRRGLYLDLSVLPYTAERLKDIINLCYGLRFNTLVVEWGSNFPWRLDKRFSSDYAYSDSTVHEWVAFAGKRGIEIIPYIACLKAIHCTFGLQSYSPLFESCNQPDFAGGIEPGTRKFMEDIIDDILSLNPGCRRIMVGFDSINPSGSSEILNTARFNQGKGREGDEGKTTWIACFNSLLKPLVEYCSSRKVKPLVFLPSEGRDIFIKLWTERESAACVVDSRLIGEVELPSTRTAEIWSALRLPAADTDTLLKAIVTQCRELHAKGVAGILAVIDYSGRYSGLKCVPIDVYTACLPVISSLLWDYNSSTTMDLAKDRLLFFTNAHSAQEREKIFLVLAEFLNCSWKSIRQLKETFIRCTLESPYRKQHYMYAKRLKASLQDWIHSSEEIEQRLYALFSNVIDETALRRFAAEYLEPIREEFSQLETRLRQLLY